MLNINAGSSPKAVLTFARATSDFPPHVDFIYFNANSSFAFNVKISQIRPLFTQSKLAFAKLTTEILHKNWKAISSRKRKSA